MKTYETKIDIDAAPAHLWHVLTEEMPRTPKAYGILRIEGAIAAGEQIKLWSDVAPKRAFALKVSKFDAPNLMVWQGGMPLGLFLGTRTFTIMPREIGCTFQMREVFSGFLSGMITKTMPDLTPSFTKFANTLKEEAERT